MQNSCEKVNSLFSLKITIKSIKVIYYFNRILGMPGLKYFHYFTMTTGGTTEVICKAFVFGNDS